MFDIDLLNKVGLQRNISRIKVNEKSKKQKIIFEELVYSDESNVRDPIPSSSKDNIISLLLKTFFL